MSYISKEKFKELANIHAPECLSIYMPTQSPVTDNQNQIRLKNQIKKLEGKLKDFSKSDDEISVLLKDLKELYDDFEFWKRLSNGLALFVFKQKLEYIISDSRFSSRIYLSDHLNLLQLIKDLHGRKDFYLLVLSANEVRYFEGNSNSINQIDISQILPESLTAVVGRDYRQKSLQYRSGQGEVDSGMYHGHGSGSESEKKLELTKFFREIDRNLNQLINAEEEIPLIIASEEGSFHLYKEINNYPFLFDEPLKGNHEHTHENELHQKCLALIKDQPKADLDKIKQRFHSSLNKGESSAEVSKIIGAAHYGQVEVLLVNNDKKLSGYFSPDTNQVTVHKQETKSTADLLNFSAVQTILKGGQVFLLNEADMPDASSPLNAVFRYMVASS